MTTIMEEMAEIQKMSDDLAKAMHIEVTPKKLQTFKDFLQDKHADNMPDAYEHWVSNLDVEQVCALAEEMVKKLQTL